MNPEKFSTEKEALLKRTTAEERKKLETTMNVVSLEGTHYLAQHPELLEGILYGMGVVKGLKSMQSILPPDVIDRTAKIFSDTVARFDAENIPSAIGMSLLLLLTAKMFDEKQEALKEARKEDDILGNLKI